MRESAERKVHRRGAGAARLCPAHLCAGPAGFHLLYLQLLYLQLLYAAGFAEVACCSVLALALLMIANPPAGLRLFGYHHATLFGADESRRLRGPSPHRPE